MTACALMQPGQPCAKWHTPPRGVCSREGGTRVCIDCINEPNAPVLGFNKPAPHPKPQEQPL